MAFENITLAGKIWRPYGLEHIILPLQVQAIKEAAEEKPRAASQVAAPKQTAVIHKFAPAQPNIQPPQKKESWKPVPVEEWPQIWRDQFKNTRHANIAWTYWNLGADLLSVGKRIELTPLEAEKSQARFSFLRKFMADLGLPKSLSTFWPPYLSADPDAKAQPEYFWSGLRFLNCRGVVIMGSPAARALLQKKQLQPLTQLLEKGQRVWILWDIETFGRQMENYQRMLTYLRQVLQPFNNL